MAEEHEAEENVSHSEHVETPRSHESVDNPEMLGEPRRVDLVVSRIDPWSALKLSFLLSFILGVIMVLATVLLWVLLDSLHVFASIRDFIGMIDDTGSIARLVDYLALPKVLGITCFVSVANVVLITALSTIGAMIYNICASLVGGLKVALLDE